MKTFRYALIAGLIISTVNTVAAVNPLTITLQSGATTVLTTSDTGTANYLVSLHSLVPRALTNLSLISGLPQGVTQVTSTPSRCSGYDVCGTTFDINPGESCCLQLSFAGSEMAIGNNTIEPLIATTPRAYQSKATPHTVVVGTTLSASVSTLALSVNCPLDGSDSCAKKNDAMTGTARQITITNTGSGAATNMSVSAPDLPSGTSISSNTCTGSLGAGETCIVTIVPGPIASSGEGGINCTTGIAPLPSTMTVGASNVPTSVSVDLYVLSYGCQYQGGYIYAIDDTIANTQGISGSLLSLVDQAGGTTVVWASNGTANGVSPDLIPYIDESESSTADSYDLAHASFNGKYTNVSSFPFPHTDAFSTCNGKTEGACNSANILAFYNTYITHFSVDYTLTTGPTEPSYYAAGICSTYEIDSQGYSPCESGNTCYSDWYLPAICELDSVNGGQTNLSNRLVTCNTSTQSVQGSLDFLIGCSEENCLSQLLYWSSTENSGVINSSSNPTNNAFMWVRNSGPYNAGKEGPAAVRCARSFSS